MTVIFYQLSSLLQCLDGKSNMSSDNSPCVVGMLWEVTDRDTDHLTAEMVHVLRGTAKEPASPLASQPSDVALLVAQSRVLPKHYVMASALCVYGLPLHLVHTGESAEDW